MTRIPKLYFLSTLWIHFYEGTRGIARDDVNGGRVVAEKLLGRKERTTRLYSLVPLLQF